MIEVIIQSLGLSSPLFIFAAYQFGKARGIESASERYDPIFKRFAERIQAAAPTTPPPPKPPR